jgi:hypothetical protein
MTAPRMAGEVRRDQQIEEEHQHPGDPGMADPFQDLERKE